MNTSKNKKKWIMIESIVKFIIYKVLRLKLTEQQINNFIQFIKFSVVGFSNTVISYIIYIVSLFALEKIQMISSIDYLIAQFIGFVLSVLWSFYWNNKYVFTEKENEERNILKVLIKTYISYAFTGLFLNSILSIFWVEVLHVSKLITPIINLLISVPLNFIINKFWAYKGK